MVIDVTALRVGMTVIERDDKGRISSRTQLKSHFESGDKFERLAFNTNRGIAVWRSCGTVEIDS